MYLIVWRRKLSQGRKKLNKIEKKSLVLDAMQKGKDNYMVL
jgi:hypothetical protein